MNTLRLLIVENDEQDLQVCRASVAKYQDEKKRSIKLVECKNLEDAFAKLDNSFDGAIVDLRLTGAGNEGNEVVKRIAEFQFRIPVAIFTGTPDAAISFPSSIGIFKKGEIQYVDLIEDFWGIYNTGLTRIMGGRGEIEQTLFKVFQKNLLPNKNTWVAYGKVEPERTEKALLRHTLNHLLQLLDEDGVHCFPEEVYIHPPLNTDLRTGSIVKNAKDGSHSVVLNPACDLAIRNGGTSKTDRILVVEIEPSKTVINKALDKIDKKDKRYSKVKSVLGNNYTDYYHWLPKTNYFQGGFLNFRKLSTLNKQEFLLAFSLPELQISPFFVKDIVSRFSSYYARQGQPDIDAEKQISLFAAPDEAK